MSYPINNNKETLNVYRASKLFTHLYVKDKTLCGFKFDEGILTIITTTGCHDVEVLQAASDYDDSIYIKYKGIIYRYISDARETPWSPVCYDYDY